MASAVASAVVSPPKKRPDDFIFTTFLGEGSFSRVRLATEKETKKEFAMKIVVKEHVIKEKKTVHVTRERDILSRLKHPFIVKLLCTFQDRERLYFCLSLAKRGEMFAHCQRVGCMDEASACFYTAEILVGLGYLHENHVIHRDLKPENVLLGWDWHVMLSDFGTAKTLPPDADEDRKASFVGTAQYVSPEVLDAKRVTYASDLWALACVLYQLLTGTTLFTGKTEYGIFQKVVAADYVLPATFPEDAADVIRKVVVHDTSKRLGCKEMGGLGSLKEHPYFSGIDWVDMHNQTPPPIRCHVPTLSLSSDGDIWKTFYQAQQSDAWEEEMLDNLTLPTNVDTTDSGQIVVRGTTQAQLDEQKEFLRQQAVNYPIWHPFCKTERIQHTAAVRRHKGYQEVEERQLILTDKRLLPIATSQMSAKKEITVNSLLTVEHISPSYLLIHEGVRSHCYQFSDADAAESCKSALEQRACSETPA